MSSEMIYPVKVRIVPNCKLAKVTANLTEQKYQKMLNGGNRTLVEKKKHKKHGEIISEYTICNLDGNDNTDPITFFDYSVLSVCDSIMQAGYKCATVAVILRGLTGKTKSTSGGTANGTVNPDQRNAIIASIEKLMTTAIRINLSDVNKKLGYNDGKEEILTDTLLPCHFVTTKINGQIVEDVIYFDRPSPIFKLADQRNQIIRYDVSLLDVPNQNNTPLVITLKNYIMLRVMEIKNHKMTPTLTLGDIFKKARIDGASKSKKQDARGYIADFFDHLLKKGVITSFEWKKKGNEFYKIDITF